MVGLGSQSFASRVIRSQVVLSFWLRRRSVRRQRSVDMVAEGRERTAVGRHGVVVEPPTHDLREPLALCGYRLMHAPPQRLLDLHELRPHAVASALPVDQEFAGARLAADEGEAQEVEGLRLAEPAPLPVGRREAAKLDQPGLVRMQR